MDPFQIMFHNLHSGPGTRRDLAVLPIAANYVRRDMRREHAIGGASLSLKLAPLWPLSSTPYGFNHFSVLGLGVQGLWFKKLRG